MSEKSLERDRIHLQGPEGYTRDINQKMMDILTDIGIVEFSHYSYDYREWVPASQSWKDVGQRVANYRKKPSLSVPVVH